jgi:hypothetical protein
MIRPLLALSLAFAGIASCKGGEVIKTAAAYEVATNTQAERKQLLAIMQDHAARYGYHVDHATDEELALLSEAAPIKFSAAVWAGANDEVYIASAMSPPSDSQRVWLSFKAAEGSQQAPRFRASLMQEVRTIWPGTKELPVLGGTTIPLPDDLIVDGDKYILDPSSADRYNEPASPRLPPGR